MSSRPAYSTQCIPGCPKLHSETLSLKNINVLKSKDAVKEITHRGSAPVPQIAKDITESIFLSVRVLALANTIDMI